MRRLYDLIKDSKPKWFKIRVNSDVKSDLMVWKIFLSTYNGKTIISKDVWCDNFSHEIYLYTSGFAFAAFLGSEWIHPFQRTEKMSTSPSKNLYQYIWRLNYGSKTVVTLEFYFMWTMRV